MLYNIYVFKYRYKFIYRIQDGGCIPYVTCISLYIEYKMAVVSSGPRAKEEQFLVLKGALH
jgi:hypothetical protein